MRKSFSEISHFKVSEKRLRILGIFIITIFAQGCVITNQVVSILLQEPDNYGATCKKDSTVNIPLIPYNGNLIVKVEINGAPAWFIIDSGSERTTITPQAVFTLKLARQTGDFVKTRGVAGEISAETVLVNDIRLGGKQLGPFIAAQAPLPKLGSDSKVVIGVLGADVLSQYNISYDFPNNWMRLYTSESCFTDDFLRSDSYDRMPVSRTASRIAMVPIGINGVTIQAVLDTGATVSALNRSAAESAGVNPADIDKDPMAQARGFGYPAVNIHYHVFPAINLGSQTISNLRVAIGNFNILFSSNPRQMLLGLDLLKNYKILMPADSDYLYIREIKN